MNVAADQMREIFLAALRLAPERRDAYLQEACPGVADLRERVKRLIQAHEELGSIVDAAASPTSPAIESPTVSEEAGLVLAGRYKLLQQIGEGGMGTVWMAQQTEPVRRLVAVKLIKAGMDSKQVLARFEQERQALALMDHANIARVLDAGTTEAGRPYFVMDLVKGVPITRYCDDNRLTPRERLELFIPVCQAIQHAHQKGVIHRDLKPSNVLVALCDGKGVPKVIDFGVAKAAGQPLTDKTLVTAFGAVVGTPEYMSPEQAELDNQDVDTRSDVYSLGVLLYELLTGSPPFARKESEKGGMLEMLRLIREQEPSKPSTKLSTAEGLPTLAANRGTEPAKLTKMVCGELDWIVMKALEKDRNRRYDTANSFAADVQRYLADEPVLACPPSASYRLRKFIRRKKWALAAAAVLGAAVLVALGGVAWSVGWANRDREVRQAAVEQEASLAFKEAARWKEQRKWPEALSAAKRAEGLLAAGGSDDLRERIRELRRDVEMVLSLEDAQLQGVDTKKTVFDDMKALDAAYLKAFCDYGIDVEALPANRAAELIRARPIRLELTGALDAWSLHVPRRIQLLLPISRAADPDERRNRLRDFVLRHEPGHWARGTAPPIELRPDQVRGLSPQDMCFIGSALLWWGGRIDDAIALLRDAQQRYPNDFWINYNLAAALQCKQPQPTEEVIRFYSAALALRPGCVACLENLARALLSSGRPQEAVVYYRKAIELDPDGATDQRHARHFEFGDALVKVGQLDEAIAEYRKVMVRLPRSPRVQHKLGLALCRKGRPEEAVACFKKADEFSVAYGADPAEASRVLGMELAQVGRWNEAAAAFDRALLNPTDPDRWRLAAALHAADGDREGYRRTCRGMLERFGDTDQPQRAERTAKACLLLPDALSAKDFDRVQKLAVRAITGTEKDRLYHYFVMAKGLADYRAGRHEDAVKWLERFPPNADGTDWDATKFAVLALAQHGLRRAQLAQASLDMAKAILAKKMPDPAKGQPFEAGNWQAWLHAQVLCHEAERTLEKKSGK